MPTTRKKVIKTVYKDESSDEEDGKDFSDSGSDVKLSEASSSEDDEIEPEHSSGDEFNQKLEKIKQKRKTPRNKPKFAKEFIKKINNQSPCIDEGENSDKPPALFSIKDLTEADKLLPSILNLSESDSSDDESPKPVKNSSTNLHQPSEQQAESDNESSTEYKDVWSNNMQIQDNSEEIAKKTFLELEQHKSKVDEAKASLEMYTLKMQEQESDVKDLLALGEEVPPVPEVGVINKKPKFKRRKDDSDSEMEDWEEVKESKTIPQQGIQLFVEFPNAGCRKTKKIDVEMMMKRKINRVKKEYQIYMHKVHVLCWLGHGNYISCVLNDQELMAAALSLVPSKECYPSERVDMKYVEQITAWYKDKLTLKQDKNENKFKPNAPPLKTILLDLINKRIATSKKYLAFIFVAMLRALGLQCRVMFNFVTLPLKPHTSELCSLSMKPKDEKKTEKKNTKTNPATDKKKDKTEPKASTSKANTSKQNLAQVDGNYDSSSDSESMQIDWNKEYFAHEICHNILQVDGDDGLNTKRTRSAKRPKPDMSKNFEAEDVSPPKIVKKSGCTSPKLDVTCNKKKTVSADVNITKNKAMISENLDTEEVSPSKIVKKRGRASPNPGGTRNKNKTVDTDVISPENSEKEDVSPPKIVKRAGHASTKPVLTRHKNKADDNHVDVVKNKTMSKCETNKRNHANDNSYSDVKEPVKVTTPGQKSYSSKEVLKDIKGTEKNTSSTTANNKTRNSSTRAKSSANRDKLSIPKIIVSDENKKSVASKYFEDTKPEKHNQASRKRSLTTQPTPSISTSVVDVKRNVRQKGRTKSAPGTAVEKSKYFSIDKATQNTLEKTVKVKEEKSEDKLRVSHRDLGKKNSAMKNTDITEDLVGIIKNRVKEAKSQSRQKIVKGKIKPESDDDSDYLPVEDLKRPSSGSGDDFKPTKISPKPSTSRRIDRRVISTSSSEKSGSKTNKIDVWCEIFVEELEQWICVDVVKGKIHSTKDLYTNATHPVCYVVGWDNNNYLKDLTRKYVPHYNTETRKLRAEPLWWDKAILPYLGPNTARNREEDEYLDQMQLEAPLPKSIGEYKNHPLYALKRHLLKFEALYPPDAAVLGFVRNEPVYARECVYICRSRDTWLKEAKVVRLGEQPYKVVKARPKWDKLSNTLITDKPLEVFGPWQVQDYEPPVAENGIVPRNAYGNVELFKDCMLPKGTVHIKLPGLNRVARKLDIDCAPAMTGFDFNGGWSHPVYDGFVVCKEFKEIVTEAWVKDQEEQERKEREKIDLRVYGNWKRLIKGLLIRERLKHKYGFEDPKPSTSAKGKAKGPKLVVKKKS